jgi:hypothetical protein
LGGAGRNESRSKNDGEAGSKHVETYTTLSRVMAGCNGGESRTHRQAKNKVMQLTFKGAYNAVEFKLYSCSMPMPDTGNWGDDYA